LGRRKHTAEEIIGKLRQATQRRADPVIQTRKAVQNQAIEWAYVSGKSYAAPFNEIGVNVLFAGAHRWRPTLPDHRPPRHPGYILDPFFRQPVVNTQEKEGASIDVLVHPVYPVPGGAVAGVGGGAYLGTVLADEEPLGVKDDLPSLLGVKL
jgi:hypothetical protein